MSEQPTHTPRVAFQGVAGAFSEQAALQFAPDGEALGFATFEQAFDAALKGRCSHACLPVENSLAGSINQTYDLLTDSVLHVVGEQVVGLVDRTRQAVLHRQASVRAAPLQGGVEGLLEGREPQRLAVGRELQRGLFGEGAGDALEGDTGRGRGLL